MSEDRRRSRGFSLSDEEMALIRAQAEVTRVSTSAALRELLSLAATRVRQDVRDAAARMIAEEKLKLVRARRSAPVENENSSVCPACGDPSNLVRFPDGRWECNLCRATGDA